jgi:hypothetical protein
VTERDSQPDPVGDLQRWLMRSGARSLSKDVTGQLRRALGQDTSGKRSDVWDTATNRPDYGAGEAPECPWCPHCRAARMLRNSREAGGGVGTYVTGASDALAAVAQEAYSAFEAAMKAPHQHSRPQEEPPARSPAADPREDTAGHGEDGGRAPDDRR